MNHLKILEMRIIELERRINKLEETWKDKLTRWFSGGESQNSRKK